MNTPEKSPTRRESILVVEDDDDVRAGYAMLLEDVGYSVIEAADGWDALEKLRTMPRPGLILLDMMMPRMNGLEFLEAMAREEAYASTPVVVVSAYAHRSAAVSERVAAFLPKPVEASTLLKWIDRFCGPEPGVPRS